MSRVNSFGELTHFSNHSHHDSLLSFVLIQKKQKIKAVNCLTAGFSSMRHHLNIYNGLFVKTT